MNNEPVAWMDKKSNITMIGGIYPKKLEQYLSGLEARIVALESHPAKTLTDEKIKETIQAATMLRKLQAKNDVLKGNKLTNKEIEDEWFKVFKPESGIGKNLTNGVYDFARAILRKAQEK